MDYTLITPNVYVKDTGTPKGRGVFALTPFKSGDIVEVCPVIVIITPYNSLPLEVQTIVFNWGVLQNISHCTAIATGYGSLYNHNNPSNMRYEAIPSQPLLRFVAVKDICEGDELTVNYNGFGGVAEWGDDNWFERTGVSPIVTP